MSTAHLIQTTLELIVVALVIIGFLYEPVLARWERKQGRKMLRAFKKMRQYRK